VARDALTGPEALLSAASTATQQHKLPDASAVAASKALARQQQAQTVAAQQLLLQSLADLERQMQEQQALAGPGGAVEAVASLTPVQNADEGQPTSGQASRPSQEDATCLTGVHESTGQHAYTLLGRESVAERVSHSDLQAAKLLASADAQGIASDIGATHILQPPDNPAEVVQQPQVEVALAGAQLNWSLQVHDEQAGFSTTATSTPVYTGNHGQPSTASCAVQQLAVLREQHAHAVSLLLVLQQRNAEQEAQLAGLEQMEGWIASQPPKRK